MTKCYEYFRLFKREEYSLLIHTAEEIRDCIDVCKKKSVSTIKRDLQTFRALSDKGVKWLENNDPNFEEDKELFNELYKEYLANKKRQQMSDVKDRWEGLVKEVMVFGPEVIETSLKEWIAKVSKFIKESTHKGLPVLMKRLDEIYCELTQALKDMNLEE